MESRWRQRRRVGWLFIPIASLALVADCGVPTTHSAPVISITGCTSTTACLGDAYAAGDHARIFLPDPRRYQFLVGKIHAADPGLSHWWFRFDYVARLTSMQVEEAVIPSGQGLNCANVAGRDSATVTPAGRHVCARGNGVVYLSMGGRYTVYLTPAQTPPASPPGTEASLLKFVDSLR